MAGHGRSLATHDRLPSDNTVRGWTPHNARSDRRGSALDRLDDVLNARPAELVLRHLHGDFVDLVFFEVHNILSNGFQVTLQDSSSKVGLRLLHWKIFRPVDVGTSIGQNLTQLTHLIGWQVVHEVRELHKLDLLLVGFELDGVGASGESCCSEERKSH